MVEATNNLKEKVVFTIDYRSNITTKHLKNKSYDNK